MLLSEGIEVCPALARGRFAERFPDGEEHRVAEVFQGPDRGLAGGTVIQVPGDPLQVRLGQGAEDEPG
jgi:hypothetical protein